MHPHLCMCCRLPWCLLYRSVISPVAEAYVDELLKLGSVNSSVFLASMWENAESGFIERQR